MNVNLLYEYETVLLGNKANISSYFFSNSPDQNEKVALDIIRYAVETFLKWSPKEMEAWFNMDIINKMKLESIIKYIQFPPEADVTTDFFIIAGKLYPHKIKVDTEAMTLLVYKKVLDGKMYKFPKGFFDDSIGYYRAVVCLQYMLTQHCNFESTEKMYATFSSSKGTHLLKKYKLQQARVVMWEYPIDYLQEALPHDSQNDYFYHFYRFKLVNEKQKRREETMSKMQKNQL